MKSTHKIDIPRGTFFHPTQPSSQVKNRHHHEMIMQNRADEIAPLSRVKSEHDNYILEFPQRH